MNSFNGAASCGTRKGRRGPAAQNPQRRASMGPRLVGRGKNHLLCHIRSIIIASMGPRLVGRGKIRNPVFTTPIFQLQWGRVLWDAESGACLYSPSVLSSSFNGAASCGTRKAE